MNSSVKYPAAFFRRRPTLSPSYLWIWALISSLLGIMVLARPHQEFPIAAEEQSYEFRPDGTYSFSYDTGGGEHQSFRMENRDATGRVTGRFGYIDPEGDLRITQYSADSTGYRANMLIFRRVATPPDEPLLVGPLPRRIPDVEDQPSSGADSSPSPSIPVGPVPFFPPDEPVLVIGPLPKPLQPSGSDDNNVDFDLDEVFGIKLSQDDPLSSGQTTEEILSSSIKDVPQGPPPNTIPSVILKTILQDNFNRLFQGSSPNIFMNRLDLDSQELSSNTLQGGVDVGNGRIPSTEDLIRLSQELLQGPEVILNMTSEVTRPLPQPLRPLRVNSTSPKLNSTVSKANSSVYFDEDDRVPGQVSVSFQNVDKENNRTGMPQEEINTSFDVFVKIVTGPPNLNLPQEKLDTAIPTIPSSSSFSSSSSSSFSSSTFSSSFSSSTSKTTSPSISAYPITTNDSIKTSPTTATPTKKKDANVFRTSDINKQKMSKPDTQRAPSLAVSINLPPVPPLIYLPADNTKVPKQFTFLGQLPI